MAQEAKGQHKLVITQEHRLFLIHSAHNNMQHHGFFATHTLLSKQYWWPHMADNISWYLQTCHACQTRQTHQVLIPPTVAMPEPSFSKVYIDTMHMPNLSGYKYIVQGRCSLIYWPEWAMLTQETGKTLGKWILHELIYRWGLLLKIVTDNGTVFLKALAWLEKHYHINSICKSSPVSVFSLRG